MIKIQRDNAHPLPFHILTLRPESYEIWNLRPSSDFSSWIYGRRLPSGSLVMPHKMLRVFLMQQKKLIEKTRKQKKKKIREKRREKTQAKRWKASLTYQFPIPTAGCGVRELGNFPDLKLPVHRVDYSLGIIYHHSKFDKKIHIYKLLFILYFIP